MEKTKKQHYVPQCYLRNFSSDFEGEQEKIAVFDKEKEQVRINQNILDNASENYFYDISFDKIISEIDEENKAKIMSELSEFLHEIDVKYNNQFVEKYFANEIEGNFKKLLDDIIDKATSATPWYIKNCFAISLSQKFELSVFLIMQFLRTKKSRETIKESYEKLSEVLFQKIYNLNCDESEEQLEAGEIEFSIDKEHLKLEHAIHMFDVEHVIKLAITIFKHSWVLYINKTDKPFYTSDAPLALTEQKHHKYMSYKGLASEGILITFPLNSHLQFCIFENTYVSNQYGVDFSISDRKYYEIYDKNLVDYFNEIQVVESYRNVFCYKDEFALAKELCKRYPEIKTHDNYISVD